MILDSSALLAILFDESDAENYARAIASADVCRISAANYVEVAIVIEAQTRGTGSRQFDTFMRHAGIGIAPVTEEQAHIARQAYVDYGRGRHKAALNFGDCFAYALAKATGESLLFKGADFREDRYSFGNLTHLGSLMPKPSGVSGNLAVSSKT